MADTAPLAPHNVVRQRAEQMAAALPPLMVAAERMAATVAQGAHGRRRVGVGETFWQFRRYDIGDPAQAIDWRQSAKTQKLFVRENEWEAAQSVWLWRDGSPSMDFRSEAAEQDKQERSTLLLLALTSLLIRGGERVALLGVDDRPSTGRTALGRMAQSLLGGTPLATPSLPDVARVPRHAQIVLIGDFLSPMPEIDAAIRRFAGQGAQGHILQVLDPAEEDLPYHGRMMFEGVEGEGNITIGRVEALRTDYHARVAARREDLRTAARGVGWTCAFHRTDRPPQTALLALYGALSDALVTA